MANPLQAADTVADGAERATADSDEHPTTLSSLPAKVEPAVILTDEHGSKDIDSLAARAGNANGTGNGSLTGKINGLKAGNRDETPTPEIGRLHLNVVPEDHGSSPSSETDSSNTRPKPARPTSIVPLFWQSTRQATRNSIASISNLASTTSGITLTDNTTSSPTELSPDASSPGLGSPLWARQVDIDDYVKIEGDVPGVGGYIVWLVKVQTLDGGGSIVLRKRYSEFEALRTQLAATFPRAGEALPNLPAKSVFYKFRASFLEKRRVGLAYFLK